jgi:hypothetical protein
MAFPGPNVEGQTMTLEAVAPGAGSQLTGQQLTLASLTVAGDVLVIPMPFKGRLDSYFFSVFAKATTAGKAATLTARVRSGATTTNMQGGVLALTSANCTPEGAVVQATPITGLNKFNRGDSLVFTSSAITAFSEGAGYLWLELVNDDTVDAISRSMGLFSVNP